MNVISPSAATSSMMTDALITICKQPPSMVLPNETFEVSFVVESKHFETFQISSISLIEDEDSNNTTINSHYYYKLRVQNTELPFAVSKDIPTTISCYISSTSVAAMFDMNALTDFPCRIQFVAEILDDGNETNNNKIFLITNSISLVPYKILVSKAPENNDWMNNIWYKDEGGRDKCMEVIAGIYDQDRSILIDTTIELSLTLCYYSSTSNNNTSSKTKNTHNNFDSTSVSVVSNQDLLRTIGHQKQNIPMNPETGTVNIRFRIEDVSKNHQGQDFCLRISAHYSHEESNTSNSNYNNKNIANGYTPPVTIRSKRNKRARSSNSVESNSSVMKQHRHLLHLQSSSKSSQSSSASILTSTDNEHNQKVVDAVRGVCQFVNDVVAGLVPLQWQVGGGYGYNGNNKNDDSDSCRSYDNYSRPYHHDMPNPNAFIARTIAQYNQSTREQMELLQRAVQLPVNSDSAVPSNSKSLPFRAPPSRRYAFPPLPPPPPPIMHSPSLAPPPPQQPPNSQHFQPPPLHPPQNRPPVVTARERGRNKSSPEPIIPISKDRFPHEQMTLSSPSTLDDDNVENLVEYILSKQFKSLKTGERLGFPAYSSTEQLIGFYSNDNDNTFHFNPVIDFDEHELKQATKIFRQASSEAIQSKSVSSSIQSMLNHALVYEWSHDLNNKNKTAI